MLHNLLAFQSLSRCSLSAHTKPWFFLTGGSFVRRKQLHRRAVALVLLLGLSASLSLAQTIRYITPSGAGSRNGTSWTNALAGGSLQTAIDASQPGDQVWVASGIYKPTTGLDRFVNFSMKDGVAIYGGFRGSETSLSQRPAINPITGQPSSTTLSGDLGTPGDNADNSHHVIISDNLSASAILDGFVLTGGNAPTRASDRAYLGGGGGGMLLVGGAPQITNCTFINNACRDDAVGGALLIRGDYVDFQAVAQPRLTNCLFKDNVALRGGAVANANQTVGRSKAFFINCIFDGNVANRGGAMYNDGAGGVADPQLVNCSLLNNSAIDFAGYDYALVLPSGGAIYNDGGFSVSRPVLTNCSLLNNSAGNGGAIYTAEYTMTLVNCVLWGNGGSNTIGYFFTAPNVVATNCLFESSETDYVGTNCLTTNTSPFAGTTTTMLAATSPAINTGLNSATGLAGVTTDLAGSPRVNNCIVDMGAYEFQSTSTASITRQPASSSLVCTGTSVVVSVATAGQVSAYQWYRNGTVISNQTLATLTLPNTTTANTGRYNVVITAGCSSLTSTAFNLTVLSSQTPDYQPLVDLYNATNGPGWTNKSNWLNSCIPCGWAGVTCDGNNRVTRLNLFNNNLNGSLPASLSALTSLQTLDLQSNNLSGTLPSSFSALINLQTLNVSINSLSGSIPTSFSALTNLRELLLFNTELSGPIPDGLSALTALQTLDLHNGQLSGPIPGNLSALTNLQTLDLSGNQLSGCLPASLSSFCGKVSVNINNNPSLPGGGDFTAFCQNGTGSQLVVNQYPSSASACVGSPFSFSVVARGATSYEWYKENQRLAETGSVLSFSAVSTADAGTYRVVVNGACGDFRPGAFTLTVRSDGPCARPDLVPILYTRPTTVYGTTPITVTVDVIEINNLASSGLITVRVAKDAKVSLSFDPGATAINGRDVQNSRWGFDADSSPGYYTLTTSSVVGAGNRLSFGLSGTLSPGATTGVLTLSAVVMGASGGEVRVNNNVDADKIDYFNK
ncbi:immunoglobulin domain-containing protein [Spirosoma validum]|uniref:Ig-like domain-containing protein n=1 Tax=Spirosoma validum TaxID=2771355 RepID=A0A927GDT7_9BACT|nr:immunoglobulin domain-containing protein [Spirosoma validum]MBD2753911.1 hypothetical protein [Spirosoma validum]